jgi:hypothetical protein
MTKREIAALGIEEAVAEAAAKEHARNYWTLHVHRDGGVSWSETFNSTDTLMETVNDRLVPRPAVLRGEGTGSFDCNCEYCNSVYNAEAEELALAEGRTYDRSNKWETREEAITECVNGGDWSDLEAAMLEELNKIPLGYFEDDLKVTVDRAKNEILADVASGRVPVSCMSFSELHDYVDANEYGGAVEALDSEEVDSEDFDTDFWNRVQHEVDLWIRAGALRGAHV